MANVTIDIAAQYKGKPAFDKAGKSVSGLEAAVNKMGKAFVGVFATQKVIAFGKAAANAFMEDQKSAALLANTMKNLGLQFANPEIETFINKLSAAAGVADDRLRPAMQGLLTTTGSLAKSQKLLAEAVDISRGSGVDLETVVQDLNNAYVGNTKGLKKYNLGLTQAQLKASSFTDIQKKLADQFAGSSAAYLTTYAGKMDVLNTAAGEAQETIGKGLIDSIQILAGKEGSIQGVADAMGNVAEQIAQVTTGLALMIKDLQKLPGMGILKNVFGAAVKSTGLAVLFNAAKKRSLRASSAGLAPSSANSFLSEHMAASNAAKAKAAEAAAAKRARDAAKAQKDNTAQLKAQAILKKSQGILDLQQIQLVAALKGNLSEQDRKSAELQLALLNGNDAAAAKLTSEILKAQDATGALTKFVNDLSNTKLADPFTAWYKTLSDVEAKMEAIKLQSQGVTPNPGSTNVPATPIPTTQSDIMTQAIADYQRGQQTIKLMVEGGDEVTSLMRFKILESSMSGSQAQIDRTLGAFDR